MPHLREHGDGTCADPSAGIVPPIERAARDRCGAPFASTTAMSLDRSVDPPTGAIVEHTTVRADATRRRAATCASSRLR